MYELFYDGEEPPKVADGAKRATNDTLWGNSGKVARYLSKLRRLLGRANEQDRRLVLHLVQKMARQK